MSKVEIRYKTKIQVCADDGTINRASEHLRIAAQLAMSMGKDGEFWITFTTLAKAVLGIDGSIPDSRSEEVGTLTKALRDSRETIMGIVRNEELGGDPDLDFITVDRRGVSSLVSGLPAGDGRVEGFKFIRSNAGACHARHQGKMSLAGVDRAIGRGFESGVLTQNQVKSLRETAREISQEIPGLLEE